MLPPLAVSVAESPVQKAVGPEMVMGKAGFTVMVILADDDPQELVTVTVYVPPVVTVMEASVDPLLHWKDVPPLAVRITESPWQNVVAPDAAMAATGLVSSVIVNDPVDVPQAFVPLTV